MNLKTFLLKNKTGILTVGFILILNFILHIIYILKIPPIWPDESIYTDTALNIIKQNRIGSDLWSNTIPAIQNHTFGYSPIFFFTIAAWFKLFGFSIYNQRLLSIVASLFFLFVYSVLSKKFLVGKKNTNTSFIANLPAFLLIIDLSFIQISNISRSEIFVLFFGGLSLVLLMSSKLYDQSIQKRRLSILLIVFAGLSVGLAILYHMMGILFFLSELSYLFLRGIMKKERLTYLFIGASLFPILIWLITLMPYLNMIGPQLQTIFSSRQTSPRWINIIFKSGPLEERLLFTLYASISVLFLIYAVLNKNKNHLLLCLLLIYSWIFALIGKIQWYFIYPIPFSYLSLVVLINKSMYKKGETIINKIILNKVLLSSMFLFLIAINLKIFYHKSQILTGDNYSYQVFSNEISKIIPENKTIFLSSIPDAYYIFKTKRNNKLYQFPPVPISPEKYLNLLDQSDYIIYNAPLSVNRLDLYLQKYVTQNTLKMNKIGGINQYEAIIIELKPKPERIKI